MRHIRTWQVVGLVLLLSEIPASALGVIGGELGATVIDDEVYWVVRFRPELDLGKFGIGLDIELLMNDDEGIRDNDWDYSHKWVRLIRYVRYGHRFDPLYARVGALDDVVIGHGFIVNHYTNWYDEDYRRLGFDLGVSSKSAGIEAFSSNLGRWEIVGSRAWLAPLSWATTSFAGRVRLGGTVAADADPDENTNTDDEVMVAGVDAELPLLYGPPLRLYLYADHAEIRHHGQGQGVGIGGEVGRFMGISEIQARLERRFLGDHFLPAYFDAFYGVERFQQMYDSTLDTTFVVRKDEILETVERGKAVYGELRGVVLGLVSLFGSYQYSDDRPHSGILHLEASLEGFKGLVDLRGRIDKSCIEKSSDIFEADERTLIEGEIGYRLNLYSMLYVRYRRTFQLQDDGSYEPVDVVVPRLVIGITF
jgi:hypothetical protein